MGCLVWLPVGLQGCCIVCCSIADVNSAWGLDLQQTGRQSLSSRQPTSLSATLAVTKSIMFSLLCHFRHCGGLWIFLCVLSVLIFFPPSIFLAFLEVNGVFSPGNVPGKEGSFTNLKTWGETHSHSFKVRGNCCSQDKVSDNGDVTSCLPGQSIPQCCLYPWPSCYGCSWHTPHDLSRSLLFGVVSCE